MIIIWFHQAKAKKKEKEIVQTNAQERKKENSSNSEEKPKLSKKKKKRRTSHAFPVRKKWLRVKVTARVKEELHLSLDWEKNSE